MSLDSRWLQIVGLGMLLHYTDKCIIGLCADKEHQPHFASLLFIFAVLNLLTTQTMCPSCVCNRSPALAKLFEVAAGIFISNMAYMTVWIPLEIFLVKIPPFFGTGLTCFATEAGIQECEPMKWLLGVLAPGNETTARITIMLAALFIAIYSAQATEFFRQLDTLFKRIRSNPCQMPEEQVSKPCDLSNSPVLTRSRGRQKLNDNEFERDD